MCSVWTFSLVVFALNLGYFWPRTYERVKTTGAAHNLTLSPYDRLLWGNYGFYLEYEGIKRLASDIKNIDFSIIEVTPYTDIPAPKDFNIVIILGETLRRDYMHCYGYPLPNTPILDSIIATNDMIAFSNVISPAPHTIASLTSLLTYHTNDSPTSQKWYSYPTLQTVLQKSGYEVSWLSNQESAGFAMQHITTLAGLSDRCQYVNNRSFGSNAGQYSEDEHYDESVLPLLEDQTSEGNDPNKGFVQIIHLMGSHNNYNNRFPKSYTRFSAQDIPTKRDTEADQIVADYVNSIYYNDYVVGNIIKHYAQDKHSIVIYFSDHGEILYDDPSRPDFYGHGLLSQGVGVEIPFLVYLSPSLREAYPSLYERIVNCKDRAIMLDLFTHTLTGLLGIRTQWSDPKLDFFSDSYDESRPRPVEGYGRAYLF